MGEGLGGCQPLVIAAAGETTTVAAAAVAWAWGITTTAEGLKGAAEAVNGVGPGAEAGEEVSGAKGDQGEGDVDDMDLVVIILQ